MQTPYDWITIAIFAGLVVIFLQRSVGEPEAQDSILSYAPPALGCAVANYLGNEGQHAIAVVCLVAVVAYTYFVLKPFKLNR